MSNRREFLFVAGALLAPSSWAQGRRVFRLGLLWITSGDGRAYVRALEDALRRLGYAPGVDVVLDERFLVGHYDQLAAAMQKIIAAKVDLIVSIGSTATQAVLRATQTIPVVFLTSSDPIKLGIVPNLARPGGNATGVTVSTEDLNAKRLELLTSAFPKVRRVGVLLYPGSAAERASLKIYEEAGRRFNVDVQPVPLNDMAQLDSVAGALPGKVDAVMVVGSTLFLAHRKAIVTALEGRRLPVMYSQPVFVDDGGLMSYGNTVTEQLSQAATHIDRIIKGARPGDLAVEQQNRFELAINQRAARASGIQFPDTLLMRADRVVE